MLKLIPAKGKAFKTLTQAVESWHNGDEWMVTNYFGRYWKGQFVTKKDNMPPVKLFFNSTAQSVVV